VANDQRKVIYQQRNDILDSADLTEMIAAMRDSVMEELVRRHVPGQSMEEQWNIAALEQALESVWHIPLKLQEKIKNAQSITDEDIVEQVRQAARAAFDAKVELIGGENFAHFQRAILLQSLDTHWRDHLAALDYLRQGIHLRGYAQKQPKQEYKREAFELFRQLIEQVKTEVTRVLLTVQIRSSEQAEEAASALDARGAQNLQRMQTSSAADDDDPVARPLKLPENARVGRNDPCPCGSGKKYKNCHGRLG